METDSSNYSRCSDKETDAAPTDSDEQTHQEDSEETKYKENTNKTKEEIFTNPENEIDSKRNQISVPTPYIYLFIFLLLIAIVSPPFGEDISRIISHFIGLNDEGVGQVWAQLWLIVNALCIYLLKPIYKGGENALTTAIGLFITIVLTGYNIHKITGNIEVIFYLSAIFIFYVSPIFIFSVSSKNGAMESPPYLQIISYLTIILLLSAVIGAVYKAIIIEKGVLLVIEWMLSVDIDQPLPFQIVGAGIVIPLATLQIIFANPDVFIRGTPIESIGTHLSNTWRLMVYSFSSLFNGIVGIVTIYQPPNEDSLRMEWLDPLEKTLGGLFGLDLMPMVRNITLFSIPFFISICVFFTFELLIRKTGRKIALNPDKNWFNINQFPNSWILGSIFAVAFIPAVLWMIMVIKMSGFDLSKWGGGHWFLILIHGVSGMLLGFILKISLKIRTSILIYTE